MRKLERFIIENYVISKNSRNRDYSRSTRINLLVLMRQVNKLKRGLPKMRLYRVTFRDRSIVDVKSDDFPIVQNNNMLFCCNGEVTCFITLDTVKIIDFMGSMA